jgi:hypothetical protein
MLYIQLSMVVYTPSYCRHVRADITMICQILPFPLLFLLFLNNTQTLGIELFSKPLST